MVAVLQNGQGRQSTRGGSGGGAAYGGGGGGSGGGRMLAGDPFAEGSGFGRVADGVACVVMMRHRKCNRTSA